MGIYEFTGLLVEIKKHGTFCEFMEFYGKLWNLMGIHWSLWEIIRIYWELIGF